MGTCCELRPAPEHAGGAACTQASILTTRPKRMGRWAPLGSTLLRVARSRPELGTSANAAGKVGDSPRNHEHKHNTLMSVALRESISKDSVLSGLYSLKPRAQEPHSIHTAVRIPHHRSTAQPDAPRA